MTDFSLDIGDLPDSPDQPDTRSVTDNFSYPVGYKFAFVGVGQAGGRIVRTFQELGYNRICAINTAVADLSELNTFPDDAKLDVGEQQGAGKDPETAAKLVQDKDEAIFDLFTRCWGNDVDYVFVCLSGAGGTGAGAYAKVAQVAKQYMREKKRPVRVGCIMALPKDAEGQRSAKNTMYSMKTLTASNLSPIIFIDNQRFKELYGDNLAVNKEKPESNRGTVKVLHTFNRLSGTDSEDIGGTTFDPADFGKVLDSGVIAFAAATVTNWASPTDITTAIREKLQKNVLASLELDKGRVAGLLYVITGAAWDGPDAVTVSQLDSGTAALDRMMTAKDSAVFPGIYPAAGDAAKIQILSMIGGLPLPRKRLQELAAKAGEPVDALLEHLGI